MGTKTAGTAPVPGGEAVSEDTRSPIRLAIDAWVNGCIHNSPVSRSVEAINHLSAQLDTLEAAIVAAVNKEI